jgi:phage terminase small subunit
MANEATKKTIRLRPDPTPPSHLSEATRAWWVKVARESTMQDDTVGLSGLTIAAEAWDGKEAARLSVEENGVDVKNRYGQMVPNPMLRVQAMFMSQYLAAIKSLHFDVEPIRPLPGAPPAHERRK